MLGRLENLFLNDFDDAGNDIYFQKELISKFSIKPVLHFEEIFPAIAPNGGMMSFIKRSDVLILRKNEPIINNILAFSQNGKNQHNTKIRKEQELKDIVLFDFDENEKLYLMNKDGDYQKIDIFNKQIHPKSTGITFKGENIQSAKLFQKGFVALTNSNSFYCIRDFKLVVPELFFSSQHASAFGEVNIEEITDFVMIPESRSASKTIELLFCSPQIPGVIRAVGWGRSMVPGKNENEYYLDNTFVIYNSTSEPFCICGNKRSEKQPNDLGIIDRIAISAKENKVAFYKKGGIVILFDSTLDEDLAENPRIVFKFKISTRFSQHEQEEQKRMLDLEDDAQFMFCGDHTLCIVGRRFIMLKHSQGNNTIVYKMFRKQNPNGQYVFAKPEIDGIRVITPEASYFISQVNSDLIGVCSPFSEEPGKKLLNAYHSNLNALPTVDKDLRSLEDELVPAIDQLLRAATMVLNSEMQLYLLKAAKHGKLFTDQDAYNHEKFGETCKTLRVVNSLRNDENPRLLTYEQYMSIKGRIIKLLVRNHNFAMAEELAKFLDQPDNEIYYKFILNHIKQLDQLSTESEELALYDELNKLFDKANDVPFLKLAKKCFKIGWNTLGNKILEKEKSALVKLPELLDQQLWKESITIALDTLDSNIIIPVLDKMIRSNDVNTFINITRPFDKLDPYIKEYLLKTDKNSLAMYEDASNQFEELFYSMVESYFDNNSYESRKMIINSMKNCLNELKRAKYDSKELDFLKSYVDELSNDLHAKEQNYKSGVIKEDDELDINCSQYDLMKKVAVQGRHGAEKLSQTSQLPERIFHIMSLDREIDHGVGKAIEMLKNEKKMRDLGLTMINIIEILYEGNHPSRVVEAAKKIVEPGYCAYKIEMLKNLNLCKEALEIVGDEKKISSDDRGRFILEILRKAPNLREEARKIVEKKDLDIDI